MPAHRGFARTNYFRVRDAVKAEAFADRLGLLKFPHRDDPKRICLISPHELGWPYEPGAQDGDDVKDPSLIHQFGDLAEPDEVVIVFEIRTDKIHIVEGCATAICNGEAITVDLDDIYRLAATKWGVEPTKVRS